MAWNRRHAVMLALVVATFTTGAAAAAEDWGPADRVGGGDRAKRLELRSSDYGRVLFDGRNRALYLFTRDRPKSECYGRCAEVWPPFKAKHGVVAGAGLKQRWVDTVRRRGGARQVTFRGQPLYFYVHDTRGEIFCNNVFEFGGKWHAVKRDGGRA
jgi:predicted lipoprotein with Yx(FWY)xxD motif